jgi:uncharacterized protein YqeY
MTLQEKLTQHLTQAMKAKDELRVSALRMVRAEILKAEKEKADVEITDELVLAILNRLVKQRRDSIEMFTQGGRDELAAKERAELEILQAYLPENLSEAELDAVIAEVLGQTGATSMREIGKVMGALMPKLKQTGKSIDGALVSQKVKAQLS